MDDVTIIPGKYRKLVTDVNRGQTVLDTRSLEITLTLPLNTRSLEITRTVPLNTRSLEITRTVPLKQYDGNAQA